MRINATAHEIVLKVVYYGPGMAGKTTNLTIIHDRMPSHAAGDLVMVDTHSERTLRFDLLAMDAGEINGHRVRFEFYTVPGQSYYAATRRAVLAGADAVVFVADSRREALDENIEAMNEMLGNLRHHGLPDDLPLVVQYNKQDLPTALKREQLEPLMNVRGWPSHASVAVDGTGVMETMQMIAGLALDRAQRSSDIPQAGAPAATPSGSWLISCYRCQAMLEVPDAKIGAVYACGICGSALEVVDPDRGLTRQPAPAARMPTPSPVPRQQRGAGEDSVYGLQTIADANGSALGVAAAPSPASLSATNLAPYEVSGYDLVAPLDETVQGRRARVRERSTGRNLRALILGPSLMRQPGYREGLEPHVRLAGQVRHPYILPLAAMTPTRDSAALFSSDPPDYEPLGHVLARRRALAPPHAVGIIRQIALALEEAARHGVVHGWLRPEVILVSPDGNVLVDEFTVPKNHRFLVRELSGASAATEYYLAPEHLSEEIRSDVRSDIFMLGALLFRMMTGEGLVTGYNAHEALHKVVANGARTLRSIQPGVSRDLDLFCQQLVATERKDRFQSYRELIDTLDKFGGGAKRQTLRLTQSVNASPGTGQLRRGGTGQLRSGGTAQLRRTGTGQLRRGGTGQLPSGLGTTSAQRRSTPSGDRLSAAPRGRKQQGSGAAVGIVVVIALVLGAAIGFLVYGNPPTKARPAPAPDPAPSSQSPASTAVPPPSLPTPVLKGGPEPTAKVPSWMSKGGPPPAAIAPSTTTPPTAAIGKTPPAATPAAVEPRPLGDPEDRISIVLRIAELERAQHFKEALDFCERLPSVDERQSRTLQVAGSHDRLKQEVEAKVGASRSIVEVAALLKPALSTWGLPGDAEWAQGLLTAAEGRLGKAPAGTPVAVPGAPTAAPVPGAALAKSGLDRAAVVDGQINQALASNQPGLALQGLTTLEAASPEAVAIKRKLDLWSKRGELIARVLSERQPKLRVPHPTTGEMWDIVGVTPMGLVVSSAAGSKTDLTWQQVSIKDFARVCQEVASHPNTKGDEHAMATVALLVAGDTVLASVQVKKGKGVLEPDAGSDLDTLVAMQRRRDAVELAARAKEAARSGNEKLTAELVDQLKRLDKSLQPLVADDLAQLDTTRRPVASTPGAPSATGPDAVKDAKDKVDFDRPEDLKVFADRAGTWQVAGGMATSSGEARLQRRDLGDARAAHLIFQPMNNRGMLNVDFRGVRMMIDFAGNTFQAVSTLETLKAKPFTFLPKVACSLYFEAKQGGVVTVEVNNGADMVTIKSMLTDNFGVATDGGAVVALDELDLSRGKPAVGKEKQAELRKLGLEPLGGAYLDPPMLVLPVVPGGQSGVAMALRDNVIGATFEAKGTGLIRIQLGNPNDRSGQWIDVPLGQVAVKFKVSWQGGTLVVTDAAGNLLGSQVLGGKSTHFIIMALQEATLMSTPQLTYQ
jgi:signal recognition particle receptor subunit beta/serine/threonine protein kinase